MSRKENHSRVDFSSLMPLGVGILSLFGICLVMIAGRLFAPRSTVLPPETATPFKYLFIGTEPAITTLTPSEETIVPAVDEFLTPGLTPGISATNTRKSGFAITAVSGLSTAKPVQELPDDISTEDPIIIFPRTKQPTGTPYEISASRTPQPTFTEGFTSTPLSFPTVAKPTLSFRTSTPTSPTTNNTPVQSPTQTPTSASTAPLNKGTYDDTEARFTYIGNWTSQNNVSGAYLNTLHVSTTIGNSITFRFIGQELRLLYQSGPSLGIMRIVIDGQEFEIDQYETETYPSSEWVSAFFTAGTHTVTIRHEDGGSVNFDQVVIPEIVPTATP